MLFTESRSCSTTHGRTRKQITRMFSLVLRRWILPSILRLVLKLRLELHPTAELQLPSSLLKMERGISNMPRAVRGPIGSRTMPIQASQNIGEGTWSQWETCRGTRTCISLLILDPGLRPHIRPRIWRDFSPAIRPTLSEIRDRVPLRHSHGLSVLPWPRGINIDLTR